VSGAPPDVSGQPTSEAAVDWQLMGAEEGTRDMTWEQIEEGADKLRAEGGKTAQILARAGALVSGAPHDASGQPMNKAAVDWLLMGAEEGTRIMTWEQIEEGADKLRVEGGRKGNKTAQIVARARAFVRGAPHDASGQPTDKATVDWLLMGAEEGTVDMTWEQIEEGADKLRVEGGATCKTAASQKQKSEGGIRSGNARKALFLAMAQDNRHSHACILPECGMFCTSELRLLRTSRTKPEIVFRHLCRGAQKQICSITKHMCRRCHRTAAHCKVAVCTYIACSRLQKFCEHLHAQAGATKTSATEASALQTAGSSPTDSPQKFEDAASDYTQTRCVCDILGGKTHITHKSI